MPADLTFAEAIDLARFGAKVPELHKDHPRIGG
jgi:hypothetical protein